VNGSRCLGGADQAGHPAPPPPKRDLKPERCLQASLSPGLRRESPSPFSPPSREAEREYNVVIEARVHACTADPRAAGCWSLRISPKYFTLQALAGFSKGPRLHRARWVTGRKPP
jgi:hypothetical protein